METNEAIVCSMSVLALKTPACRMGAAHYKTLRDEEKLEAVIPSSGVQPVHPVPLFRRELLQRDEDRN